MNGEIHRGDGGWRGDIIAVDVFCLRFVWWNISACVAKSFFFYACVGELRCVCVCLCFFGVGSFGQSASIEVSTRPVPRSLFLLQGSGR